MSDSTIPDAAVEAAGQALQHHMVGDDLECVPEGAGLDETDAWVRAIDMAAEEAMPAVLAAALPHLVTDEMVERAARALGSHGDDGFANLEEAARAALTAALRGPDA